jgi:hypothetical protein
MPRTENTEVVTQDEATTLQEFCLLLSQTDRRVELISAFEASERQSGVVKDHPAAFQARFVAFSHRPV